MNQLISQEVIRAIKKAFKQKSDFSSKSVRKFKTLVAQKQKVKFCEILFF